MIDTDDGWVDKNGWPCPAPEKKKCGNCLNKTKSTGDLPCAKCWRCFDDIKSGHTDKWEPTE